MYHEILMNGLTEMYANKISSYKMIFAHFRLILRILDAASQFQIIYVYSRLFLRILYGDCVQDQSVRRTLENICVFKMRSAYFR